jgi:hypothetical protein
VTAEIITGHQIKMIIVSQANVVDAIDSSGASMVLARLGVLKAMWPWPRGSSRTDEAVLGLSLALRP